MEKLGIVSEGSDSYTTNINSSASIIFSPPKPKKAIIDVNESKQHVRASTTAVVQILEELSEDMAQHFAVNKVSFIKL
jgi:hypothetical protein